MAYGCPVCGELQADGEHLANHLAVTASLHGDDHASWLADHVPDWPERSPTDLGEAVVPHAEEREDAPAWETAGEHEGHGEGAPGTPSFESAIGRQSGAGRQPTPETERVLREARELTERMERDEAASAGDETDEESAEPDVEGEPAETDGEGE